jgi:outer membrane protein assembly factor BamB
MSQLCTAVILVFTTATLRAADWPQWLGPERNGSTPEKVAAWKGQLKVLWHKPVGQGHSSPVVAGGRVYLFTQLGSKEEEALTAYDAKTGEQLWQKSYARPSFLNKFGTGPRATPAVVDGRIYTFGVTGILTCFTGTGKQLWQVDTLKKFQTPKLFFGTSCSPLVSEGKVFINVGGKGAAVVAFDAGTGKVIWKALDDGASYSSPVLLGKSPRPQLVFLTQEGLVSLNPANGKLYWRFPFKDKLLESSTTPVQADGLLVASSITLGAVGLRLEIRDGKPAVAPQWKEPALTCYFSTPVAAAGQLYLVTGANPLELLLQRKASATLHCIEPASGKELWKKKGVGIYHASLVHTGDDKLLLLEEKGDLVLLQPNAKGYKELARSHVCGETWAYPALAHGRLYVRDRRELICVSLGSLVQKR